MQLTAEGYSSFWKNDRTLKILRVMKITTILLLIFCLHVAARSDGQNISLSAKNTPLRKVLTDIEKQSGYSFIYEKAWVDNAAPVTVEVKSATLNQVLEMVFQNEPIAYKLSDKYIVLSPKQISENKPDISYVTPPPVDISGRVTDKDGNPLPGASIEVKGTKNGTSTDVNGFFTLKNVSADDQIVISYSGYLSQTLKIGSKTSFPIALEISEDPLDQVKIIAYGRTTQRYSTSDVSSITSKDIQEQPVGNPLLALEGRTTGTFITQSSGLSGTGAVTRIQGQNSITNGNDPLYVVDGVPYNSQLLPQLNVFVLGTSGATGTNSGNMQGNPLSFINPDDIESISILKDADATAIYGSRAANGAIIITTKKGTSGKTTVDFNLQQGFGKVAHFVDMLNTNQYLQMRHEGFQNAGQTPSLANGDYDILLWDTTRNTDWQKTLIGGTSHYTDLNASVSGGSANVQYFLSTTYHRETTVFPGNFDDEKGAVHLNLNTASNNQKFHMQVTANYMVDNNFLPTVDLTSVALELPPDAPPLYNSDGTLNWALNASGTSTWPASSNSVNPLAYTLKTYDIKTNNLVSNTILSYEVLPNLQLKSNFGYTYQQQTETEELPKIAIVPQNRPSSNSVGYYGYENTNSWLVEPQLEYNRMVEKGKLDVLLGSTFQEINRQGTNFYGIGYPSDDLLANPSSASQLFPLNSTSSTYDYNAVFARLNYNYNDKYLLDFSARRDGSSRFGSNNKFHNFGAVGLGWILSNEDFFKQNISFLSFAKLRGSYGTTGNDQIGDYQFLSTYSAVFAPVTYQGIGGLQPNALANPYLEWEETKKLNLGINLGAFKDRVLVDLTYFRNLSSNELLGYQLPITTGYGSITANFPATVKNSGWEISLQSVNVRGKKFSWTSSFNITIPKNELTAFPNLASSTYSNSLVIGQPINVIKTFHGLGPNDTTGIYQFATHAGPIYGAPYAADYTTLINVNPKYFGGFQNTISYNGFNLDVLFQFVKQMGSGNMYYGIYPGPGYEGYNQPVSVLNRWQKPGDIKPIEKFTSDFSLLNSLRAQTLNSDAVYTDASFIRLKNVSLSWQVPGSWIKKAKFQSLRIYTQGQNLLTFTHYSGLDPETKSMSSLPPLRVITFGLQAGF